MKISILTSNIKNRLGRNQKYFVKYSLIGLLNTLVSYSVYSLFLIFGFKYAFALLLSYVIGIVNSYFWNRHWSFRSKSPIRIEAIGFVSVYVASFFINLLLLKVLIEVLLVQPFIAQVIAIILTVPLTFLLMRYRVFKK